MRASLIVAMTRQRLIGRNNDLPWHWPEDLKHFKRSTVDQTVISGRRSHDSVGGPLPKRTNLVVSRSLAGEAGDEGIEHDGARAFGSLAAACRWVDATRPGDSDHAWILGGAEIFRLILEPLGAGPEARARAGLPRPERLVVTWVPDVPLQDGDVLFPYDEAWIDRHYEATERRAGTSGELEFVTYRLRNAG